MTPLSLERFGTLEFIFSGGAIIRQLFGGHWWVHIIYFITWILSIPSCFRLFSIKSMFVCFGYDHMTYDLKVFNLKYFYIVLLFMIQLLICLAFSLCPSFLLLSSFGFPENTLFLSLPHLAWKSCILSHLTTRIRENPEFTPLPPTVPHMSALYLVSMRPWNAAAVSKACNYYLFFYLCLNPQN